MRQLVFAFQLVLLLMLLFIEQALTLPIWFLFFSLLTLLSVTGMYRLFAILTLGFFLSLSYQLFLGFGIFLFSVMLFSVETTRRFITALDLRVMLTLFAALNLIAFFVRQEVRIVTLFYYVFSLLFIVAILFFSSRKRTKLTVSRFL